MALPIYGVYKILKSLIAALREYKILTVRILNEVLIIPIGAVVFLPIFGLLGAGFVYIAIYMERNLFFYSRLIKKYPDFRIKLKTLFKFDKEDKDLLSKIFKRTKNLFGSTAD